MWRRRRRENSAEHNENVFFIVNVLHIQRWQCLHRWNMIFVPYIFVRGKKCDCLLIIFTWCLLSQCSFQWKFYSIIIKRIMELKQRLWVFLQHFIIYLHKSFSISLSPFSPLTINLNYMKWVPCIFH